METALKRKKTRDFNLQVKKDCLKNKSKCLFQSEKEKSINKFFHLEDKKIRSMRKIVDLMKTVFVNHSANLDTNNCNKVNFWCPSGMNPIKNDEND